MLNSLVSSSVIQPNLREIWEINVKSHERAFYHQITISKSWGLLYIQHWFFKNFFIKSEYKYVYLILCYSKLLQSCPTVCDPVDRSPLGSSVHGILQARTPELVATPFYRRYSRPRNRTQTSRTAGRFFTVRNQESPLSLSIYLKRKYISHI